MAVASKCDRCGLLYEQLKAVPNLRLIHYYHPFGDERYDLCPECQKELEEWIKAKQKKLRGDQP